MFGVVDVTIFGKQEVIEVVVFVECWPMRKWLCKSCESCESCDVCGRRSFQSVANFEK